MPGKVINSNSPMPTEILIIITNMGVKNPYAATFVAPILTIPTGKELAANIIVNSINSEVIVCLKRSLLSKKVSPEDRLNSIQALRSQIRPYLHFGKVNFGMFYHFILEKKSSFLKRHYRFNTWLNQ